MSRGSYSFVMSTAKGSGEQVAAAAGRLTNYNGQAYHPNFGDTSICFRNGMEAELYFTIDNNHIYLLPTSVHTGDMEQAAYNIGTFLSGKNGIDTLPFDTPSFIALDQKGESVWVFESIPGFLPVYFFRKNDGIWLSSEMKTFIGGNTISLRLRPYEYFEELQYTDGGNTASIFEGVERLRQGELLYICNGSYSRSFPRLSSAPPPVVSNEEEWPDHLFELLYDKTTTLLHGQNNVGLALSGGYDSGSLAGLITRSGNTFQAFSIGTETVNEFAEAKKSADYFGGSFRSSTIQPHIYEAIFQHSLFLNELNDPVISEAFPGIYKVCQLASGHSSSLFTGYGADILLGNLLGADITTLNNSSLAMLNRTAQTGELSTFISDSFNITVYPVYLCPEIINFCLQIPGALKMKNGINKYVQRQMIEKFGLLPPGLLNVKKKGLHEGAGLPGMFDSITGNHQHLLTVKRKYMHECLKMLFEQGIAPGECNTQRLIELSHL